MTHYHYKLSRDTFFLSLRLPLLVKLPHSSTVKDLGITTGYNSELPRWIIIGIPTLKEAIRAGSEPMMRHASEATSELPQDISSGIPTLKEAIRAGSEPMMRDASEAR
ncbi:hypothetical protein L249_2850 [Ophiocordyceps polyrhachis-furcata BCC 54312]|uniref:Uncharacterized protein n=1 Tax=Ophiocordyceps polyrhachis-furcata BCC 54312 TaxID=1330021 RepID=A0A367LS75_9HYPO|nr:hypothetical protein L249_2850 [Ophiocordyceps polyrhachis-furcata BCC 54312]